MRIRDLLLGSSILRSPEDGGGAATPAPAGSTPASSSGPSSTPSTPSPEPSPASSAASQPGSAGSQEPGGGSTDGPADFDFSSIFDAPADAPVVAPPAPAASPAPAAQPQAPAPGTPQQPQVQSPQPTAPPAAQAPQQPVAASPGTQPEATPQSPPLDPADPISLARALVENEQVAIDHVASTMFRLSDEDVAALEADTAGFVPKLLARVLVKAQQQTFTQLSRVVPMMIQRQAEATQRHSKNEDKFYERWHDLKRDTHGDLVRRYGAVYRQMHPQATLDQMIEDLGPMVMMAAKVAPTPRPMNGTQPQTAPGTPRPAPPPPFQPAQPGAVGLPQQVETGTFDFMGGHND